LTAKSFRYWFYKLRTLTHKKQKMWPQGRRAGWMQVCRQIGHSKAAAAVEGESPLLIAVAENK